MSVEPKPGSPGRTRVAYITVVNVGTIESGGSLVCRQHIERLHSLPSVDLTVCLIGTNETNAEGQRYLAELGIPCKGFQLGHGLLRPLFPFDRWPFSLEELALRSQSTNNDFRDFVQSNDVNVFVLDYLFTALFVAPVFEFARRIVVITLNPEAEFYENLRILGRLPKTSSKSPVAVFRLRQFENWIYRHAINVVALSPNDIPKGRKVSTTVIRPAIEPKFLGWQYSGRKEICFVGNIAHFPNWLAVRWLCNEFAPAVAARDSAVRIQIIGATSKDVPAEWQKTNVSFLGTASGEVQERMLTCGIFIAPIENNYGSKIKVLECLAYGTPVLATREALAGIEDYAGLPLMTLSDPVGAADAACRLLSDLEGLLELSAIEGRILAKLSAQSTAGWEQLMARLMKHPPRKAVPRILNFPTLLWGSVSSYREGRKRKKGEKVNLAKGNAPDLLLEGFDDPAIREGDPIRWTEGMGRIRIKGTCRAMPRKLRLECWSLPEDGPKQVTVRVNRQVALTMNVSGNCGTQTVNLPRQVGLADLIVEIEGGAADDLRLRGVPLRRLQVIW